MWHVVSYVTYIYSIQPNAPGIQIRWLSMAWIVTWWWNMKCKIMEFCVHGHILNDAQYLFFDFYLLWYEYWGVCMPATISITTNSDTKTNTEIKLIMVISFEVPNFKHMKFKILPRFIVYWHCVYAMQR